MSLLNHKSFIASYLATAHLALRVNGTSSSLINLALILQGQIAPPQPFPESPSNSAGSLLCNVHLVHLVQLAPHFAVASKRHNHPFARATRAGRATRMPAQIAAFPCAPSEREGRTSPAPTQQQIIFHLPRRALPVRRRGQQTKWAGIRQIQVAQPDQQIMCDRN
jgi:hypothetical protein